MLSQPKQHRISDKTMVRLSVLLFALTIIVQHFPLVSVVDPTRSAAGRLSSVIPEGYRAVTVKVDDVVGVSGFILPGALVDVVVMIMPPKGSVNDERISKIVLQNIKVLASGQNIDKPKNEPDPGARAVTLEVTPEQAEKLALASSEGRLQLILGPHSEQLIFSSSSLPPQLATQAPIKKSRSRKPSKGPEPPPAPPRPTIEVIEGAKDRASRPYILPTNPKRLPPLKA